MDFDNSVFHNGMFDIGTTPCQIKPCMNNQHQTDPTVHCLTKNTTTTALLTLVPKTPTEWRGGSGRGRAADGQFDGAEGGARRVGETVRGRGRVAGLTSPSPRDR